MPTDPILYPSQLLTQPGTDAWLEMLSVARPVVIETIKTAGGTSADGEVFFQTSVVQAAVQSFENAPAGAGILLTNLALAHYRSWLNEHGQEPSAEDDPLPEWLPDDDILKQFRKKVFAWKRLRQLGPICREKLVDQAPDQASCQRAYLALLFPNATERPENLPPWALDAVADAPGYNTWLLLQQAGETETRPSAANKPWIRIAFFITLLFTGAWYVYQYMNAPVPTEKVFASNFTPPESILADMQSRYAKTNIPEECLFLFENADNHYRAGNMELAQEPLLLLVIDTMATACHSDAWFYLGVVRLKLDDPQTAIDCFSKIENLEAFGEDLYWYQGLAFVRLAAGDPSRRTLARRAVERALANSTQPERKQQAAEMLKDLSD